MPTGPRGSRVLATLTVPFLLLAACGIDRQDALDDLIEAGYEPESAECIMSALESDGYEAADLADPLPAEVEVAIGDAVQECITAADLAGLGEQLGEEQLREQVITQLVGGGMAPADAECIIDRVGEAGFTMVDLAQAGLEEETGGGVLEAIQAASIDCIG